MPFGPSYSSSSLAPLDRLVPWQFRMRPALVTTVVSVVAVSLVIGLLVAGRRLLGALTTELPPSTMMLTALIAATVVACARIAWRRNFPLESQDELSPADRVLGWTSSAALALLAVGCCYPANRTADWLIWLPVLIADQFWRQNFFDAGEPWAPSSDKEDELQTSPTLTITESPGHDNIVQQLYRLQDEHGLEVIYGTVRANFVTGQRTAVVHIGFCPPLTYLPEIEAEALPGSLAETKVVQALAHGARLDVRLPAPAPIDCQVWIDLAARPVGAIAEVKTA